MHFVHLLSSHINCHDFNKIRCLFSIYFERHHLSYSTKVLARIPLEYMDTMCMESKNRWKRGAKARSNIFYVDKHLLYDLLTQNKLVFEQVIICYTYITDRVHQFLNWILIPLKGKSVIALICENVISTFRK